MTSLASLAHVGVTLGESRVLNGVTIAVSAGQVVGVAGSNGSGKTTLLRVLATLLRPRTGEGQVLGADLGSNDVFGIRSQIAMISHVPAVIPELTLEENLVHAARVSGHDMDRVATALRVVGLEGVMGRRGSASSFGMLRRAEIARLLITRPKLVLLDEAFSGLDSDAQALIDALIDRTVNAGGAAVVVSHDRAQLRRATTVFALSAGTLEEMA